jgi:hypothetical protein
MYTNLTADVLVVLVTATTVALAVLVHYEGLAGLSAWLARPQLQRRRRVLLGVYGVILLHVVEIWLFGSSLWMLLRFPDTGAIIGTSRAPFLDAIYLSSVTFSTVGFGDLAPLGPIRFLSGTEALTGFILITWSASFLYLEMEQYWRKRPK